MPADYNKSKRICARGDLMEKKRFQMSDSMKVAIFIVLSGGFQDAYTYFCRGSVFANAQTGNIVLLASNAMHGNFAGVLKYLIPIFAFMLGTAFSERIHVHFRDCVKVHWRQLVLLCEIVQLFIVGFIPQSLNPLANALVSFVCAMQVQSFHTVYGQVYASTMCIGNLRSGVEALCRYFQDRDSTQLNRSITYFSVIFLFALGAGFGVLLTEHFGIRAIWLSCALLTIGVILMFKPEDA